jgi:TrmH family RNA methyltransferase
MPWPIFAGVCVILPTNHEAMVDGLTPPGTQDVPEAAGSPAKQEGGLRVVLLGPKRGANVGAVCRAIKNMGAGRLVVLGGDYDRGEALRTAVHADDVFEARLEARTFDEAVASSSLVIGTSPREAPWRMPVRPIDEVFAEARGRGLEPSSIALVFGPEDRGLNNEELARCHRIAFVPTSAEYSSLNLAQAAVVCLYEWLQSGRPGRGMVPAGTPVPAGEASVPASASAMREALADLADVLVEIDFLHGDQSERVMATVSSMLTRGGLDDREVRILRGLVRQIRWAARRGGGDPR